MLFSSFRMHQSLLCRCSRLLESVHTNTRDCNGVAIVEEDGELDNVVFGGQFAEQC